MLNREFSCSKFPMGTCSTLTFKFGSLDDSIPVGGLTPLNRIVSTSFCAKNVFVDEESDAVPGPVCVKRMPKIDERDF